MTSTFRISICFYLLLLTLGGSLKVSAAEMPMIEVITSDAFPITGIQSLQQQGFVVKVYNLDNGKRLTSQLAANLAGPQERAKAILEQRLKKLGDDTVKSQFMSAYQGLMLGTQYGLSRYPAVVFNQGKSVIYGVTEMSQAILLYQQWKAKQ